MRLIMNQQFFSWGDDFAVRDEQGQDRYYVDGKVFALGDQLAIRDAQGAEVARIQSKLLAWTPTYEIHRAGQLYATLNKTAFTFFRCQFTIDAPGPDDLVAEGDFWEHEYTFARGSRPVATVSKRWFSLTDTYGIEIADEEDSILILASAVIIDLICHDEKQE